MYFALLDHIYMYIKLLKKMRINCNNKTDNLSIKCGTVGDMYRNAAKKDRHICIPYKRFQQVHIYI